MLEFSCNEILFCRATGVRMSGLRKGERKGLMALLTRLVADIPEFVRRRTLRRSLLGIGIRA